MKSYEAILRRSGFASWKLHLQLPKISRNPYGHSQKNLGNITHNMDRISLCLGGKNHGSHGPGWKIGCHQCPGTPKAYESSKILIRMGGFLKWWVFRQSIHFKGIFHYKIINHPFWGVSQFLETPVSAKFVVHSRKLGARSNNSIEIGRGAPRGRKGH